MENMLRRLGVRLQNLIVRAVVDRSGKRYQVQHLGGRVSTEREHLEPQGVHFRAPAGAQGLLISPAGETASAVLMGCQGTLPTTTLADGEGGLHYLGTFKVFCKANGQVILGSGAADFVALAGLVKAQLDSLAASITTLKAATSTGVGGVPAVGSGLAATFNATTVSIPATVGEVKATQVKAV
jgi:phage gp45-like